MPITTIVIVLMGVLLNNNNLNARLSDVNTSLNKRMDNMNYSINARMDDLRDMLRAEIAKNHGEMLAKFAELDTRLMRSESHLRLS